MRRTAGLGAGGLCIGPILIFLWNTFMPENQLPPEVAAAVGGLCGTLMGLLIPAPGSKSE